MRNRTENIFRFWVLAGLTVALAFTEGDVFAQAKWVPKKINIDVPIIASHSDWSQCTGKVHDTTWLENQIVYDRIPTSGVLNTYSRVGNNVKLAWGYSNGGTNISFYLDSVLGILRNFDIESGPDDYSGGTYWTRIILLSVKFVIVNDSLLSAEGYLSSDSITAISYKHESFVGYCSDCFRCFYGTSDIFNSLQDSAATFSITFVKSKPVNTILSRFNEQEFFIVSTFFSDHTIHFSFPSSPHSQTMSIYDILGREISKIEIPAGSTSYVLQSPGFPKGTYFARLGSSSAHFVIE